ncbi:putative secreted protein (Por secretion system target) [Aquimarina sp. MAR_2010_214]|uniref:T9SS type A sorting domain-containing protein n=1 Tax=Aquimarina sp. MAR_2010_214 TaxID=1250026 RepID=UPI000CB1AB5D|nr:T9SS type A sorting domain-containing protein [Aquimarina sp. MAR_2010_214]PKV49037.1 putative secreted protein (Por secretion system target) [Aquimarina sp. MAR_2010_214]
MFALALSAKAQHIQKFTIGHSGGSTVIKLQDNVYTISQSIAQKSVIGTFIGTNYVVLQGYQNPLVVKGNVLQDSQSLKPILYPNPTASVLHVDFEKTVKSTIDIDIIDLNGKTIFSKTYDATNSIDIDVSLFSSGTYLIRISTAGTFLRSQIIKN